MSGIIGRIYKITSNETDYIYIGSTTKQLNDRFSEHKTDYKRNKYVSSSDIVKYADAKIELIHEGLFNDRKDIEKFEGETIRTTPNAINKNIPGTTRQEQNIQYKARNKDKIKEQRRQYYEQNKDKINEQKRHYTTQQKQNKLNVLTTDDQAETADSDTDESETSQ